MIHQQTNDFISSSRCYSLDLAHLIDQPVAALLPLIQHRPTDITYVMSEARELRTGRSAQCDVLEWGFCHSDFHGGNARLDSDGLCRIFDFDCCGPGWRAYDLAVCR